MISRNLLQAACLILCAFALNACRTHDKYDPSKVPAQPWLAKRNAVREPSVSKPEYKEFSGRVNQKVLNRSNTANTSVIIDIAAQKGYLLVSGDIAAESPVSTAKPGKYTPTGTFSVTERVRSGKISTIYKVAMPYWMRLGDSPIGVHAGYVPGYPASAGCIRMPSQMARLVYDHTQSGTKVHVYSSWGGS